MLLAIIYLDIEILLG